MDAYRPEEKYANHALNLLYYVALDVAARALNNAHVPPNYLSSFDMATVTDGLIDAAYDEMYQIYQYCGGDDKAAKSPAMKDEAIKFLEKEIHGKGKS